MTDIEKRKAAINKLKYKSLITTEDDDFDYIAFPKGGRDAFIEALYELLAPSPQAPDNEVDEAIRRFKSVSLFDIRQQDVDVLIKAAQLSTTALDRTMDDNEKLRAEITRLNEVIAQQPKCKCCECQPLPPKE